MANLHDNLLNTAPLEDFGARCSDEHGTLYRNLNREILEVCRDLPESLRVPGTMVLMAGGLRPGEAYDFCAEFPVPLWSVLDAAGPEVTSAASHAGLYRSALTAQAMSFLLHLMDDHIIDGQTAPSILLLQLRTAVWNRFARHIEELSRNLAEAERDPVRSAIDLYFESLHHPEAVGDLDAYLERSRREMHIWSAAPALLALHTRDLFPPESAPGTSFWFDLIAAVSTAWRLVDDLRDWQDDAVAGHRSAVYYLLSPESAGCFDAVATETARLRELEQALRREGVLERAVDLALETLRRVRRVVPDACPGLAADLDNLCAPLMQFQADHKHNLTNIQGVEH